MSTPMSSFRRVAGLAVAGILLTGGAVSAQAAGSAGATAEVTRHGVGDVRLGDTAAQLKEEGLIGRLRPGCELEGPKARTAALKGDAKGFVNFTTTMPRRVRDIQVTKGAAAEGVGIGATRKQVRNAFPHARFDGSTRETFGITLVTVPKRDGGRFQFALRAGKVDLIGVPNIAFCE